MGGVAFSGSSLSGGGVLFFFALSAPKRRNSNSVFCLSVGDESICPYPPT